MIYEDDFPADEPLFLWLIKTHLITGRSWFVMVSRIVTDKTTVKQNKNNDISIHTHLGKKRSVWLATEQRNEMQSGKRDQQKRIWEVKFHESQSILDEGKQPLGAASHSTICSDGDVLHLCCPAWRSLATRPVKLLKWGGDIEKLMSLPQGSCSGEHFLWLSLLLTVSAPLSL